MNTNCNIPVSPPLTICSVQPEDYNCNLAKLINSESCVGNAVYAINNNFFILSDLLIKVKQRLTESQDAFNKINMVKDQWKDAYMCVCANSANWIDMYDAANTANNAVKPPILTFYPQIFEKERWSNYTPTEIANIKNDPVTKWVNYMFPAQAYSKDMRLVCCILIRDKTPISALKSKECPTEVTVADRYTTLKDEVLFKIDTTTGTYQWKI